MMPEVFSKLSPIYAYPELLKLLDNNIIVTNGTNVISIARQIIIVDIPIIIIFPKV